MRKTQTKLPSEGKTSIRPKLNVRKDTTSDHYTVVIQIIRHRRRCVLFTPYRLRKEEFDDMRGIAITRQRNRTHREYIGQVNDYLRYHTGELYRLVHSMEQSGNPFEASDVLAHYRQRDDKRYVETYLLHLVEKCRNKGRYGSAQTFVSTLSVFRKFAGGRQFLLDDLDERQVLAFRDYLQDMGLKPNTVTFYMSKLRAAYNRGVAEGHANSGRRPFDAVTVKNSKTWKLAISDTLMQKVSQAKLTGKQNVARDMFLFSFYCRGMSFVDMAYLRQENIREGVIRYRRRKTGQLFTVRILPEMQEIIDRYRLCSTPYVFPILSAAGSGSGKTPHNDQQLYDLYCRSRCYYLHLLQDIARKLGTDARLSFGAARHTWASRARRKNIAISVISEGLGHTTERTTRIYLEEMEPCRIDEANRIVTTL